MSPDATPHLPQPILVVLERFGVDASQTQTLMGGSPPILYLPIAGSIAIDAWTVLRGVVDDAQVWPVLLGDEQSIRLHQDDAKRKEQLVVEQLLADSFTTDTAMLNAEQTEQMRRWLESSGRALDYMNEDDGVHGDWPDELVPNNQYAVPYDWRTREPVSTIYMGFVPTIFSWQVPAFLRFGEWNSTPPPAIHAAQLRAWEQQYSAEVVALTHDVIEMRVARPPTTREAALTLASEQYAYCPDIVDQGVGTIEELAATLVHATVWYFWWD